MRQHKPRKYKPLFFSLSVYTRDSTLVDVKEQSMQKWHETIQLLDHKGALPKPTDKQNILEMIQKGL